MSGGGGTNTVTQSAEPPAFIQPFIQQALQGAQDQFQNFAPQFFPGSTVAGQSPFTQQGVDQLTQFGNSSFNQNVLGNAQDAQASLTGFNPVLQAGMNNLPQDLQFLQSVQDRTQQGQTGQQGLQPQGGGLQQFQTPQGATTPQQGVQGQLSALKGTGSGLTAQQRIAASQGQSQSISPAEMQQMEQANSAAIQASMNSAKAGQGGHLSDPAVQAELARRQGAGLGLRGPQPTDASPTYQTGQPISSGALQPQQAQSFPGSPGGTPTQVEGLSGQVAGDTGNALSGILNTQPGSNPFVDQLISDVQGLNNRSFEQGVLPSIQNQSEAQGVLGGSRQGVAEGIGLQGLADANARAATQISSDQFNQDMNRLLQASQTGGQIASNAANAELGRGGLDIGQQGLGINAAQLSTGLLGQGFGQGLQGAQSSLALSPALQQLGLGGTQSLLAGGDIDQNFRQSLLNDEVNRFNFTQQQPAISQSNFQNAAFGLPSLVNQSTTSPAETGGIAGAVGGAAAGLGLLGGISALGPGAAAVMAGPVGWATIALGALGGFL